MMTKKGLQFWAYLVGNTKKGLNEQVQNLEKQGWVKIGKVIATNSIEKKKGKVYGQYLGTTGE